jgi:hypothetical protein
MLCHSALFAQYNDTVATKNWAGIATAFLIMTPDGSFALPMIQAHKGKLHLEGRYNYEDLNTISLFAGYNFYGTKKLKYTITPILGFAAGNTNGIVPGLKVTLTLNKFTFYTENEYVFEVNGRSNSFFYSWSQMTIAPKDWFWLGVSWQRLKAYQSQRALDKGFVAGVAYRKMQLIGYYFNPGAEGQFGVVGVNVFF